MMLFWPISYSMWSVMLWLHDNMWYVFWQNTNCSYLRSCVMVLLHPINLYLSWRHVSSISGKYSTNVYKFFTQSLSHSVTRSVTFLLSVQSHTSYHVDTTLSCPILSCHVRNTSDTSQPHLSNISAPSQPHDSHMSAICHPHACHMSGTC